MTATRRYCPIEEIERTFVFSTERCRAGCRVQSAVVVRPQRECAIQQPVRLIATTEQHEHAGGVIARVSVVRIDGETPLECFP